MTLEDGKTYRLQSRAATTRSLNVYGTSPTSLANVCLWTNDNDDICQQWVYREIGGYKYLQCKGNSNLYLDLYTGTSGGENVSGFNAHVFSKSETSRITVEEVSGKNYIRIKLANYTNRYLTAYSTGSNGTSSGRSTTSAGNVYFSEGRLTGALQDWLPVCLDDSESESGAKKTLAQLKTKFPNGKYWNHMNMSSNNQDGYTSVPCTDHSNANIATCNAFKIGNTTYSWQCMGFAEKCGYDFTGSNPCVNGEWTTYTASSALNNLKPGDIVRYYSNSAQTIKHSIFVTGVSGDTVTFGDCNADYACGIRWGATISKQTLASRFIHLRSAPYTLH